MTKKPEITKEVVVEKEVVEEKPTKKIAKVDNRAKRRAGFYWEDGQPFVSVTTALGVIEKPALRYWATKQVYWAMALDPSLSEKEALAAPFRKSKSAMSRGTMVHSMVEAYRHNQEYVNTVPESTRKYAQAFFNWVTDNSVEVLVQEKSLVSRRYCYAGTFDLLVRFKNSGRVLVVDIKTGKGVYEEVFLQLSAYKHALEENGVFAELKIDPEKVGMAVCNLQTGEDDLPTGNYQFQEGEDVFNQFLAAKYLWEYKNKASLDKINASLPPGKRYIPLDIKFETIGKEVKNMSTLQYVQPTDEQKVVMQSFRDKYETLFTELKALPGSRGMSLCLTKLEESAMWLNKAITKND